MYPTNLLTTPEKSIRKYWLALLFALVISDLISFIYGFFFMPIPKELQSELQFFWFFAEFMTLFFFWLNTYIPYRCAYKNPGTKILSILTVYLLLTPFSNLMVPKELSATRTAILSEVDHAYFYWIFYFLNLALGCVWAYFCILLRKINKRMQHAMLYESNEYVNASTTLQESQSLEALDSGYHTAIQNRSKKFIAAIKKVYAQRKKELAAT